MAKLYNKNLQTLEKKKERLRELFIEEIINKDEFQYEVKKLQEQITTQKEACTYSDNWYQHMENLLDTLFNFGEIIKKGSYSEKKSALELLSPNLVWNEEKLLINKADWLKIFIEGRNEVLHQYPMFEPKNELIFKGLNGVLDIKCPTLLGILDRVRKIACKL